ncbi:MAG: urease accessory UreF family protein [Verrucomicrobiota bacterium]|nr:urease accessory UreF family protein [Verrucomicrobiota bacterium]
MSEQLHIKSKGPANYAETQRLEEQLGSADEAISLAEEAFAMQVARIETLPALREFLKRYESELLVPHELEVIYRAWQHASKNELRELIELDCSLEETTKQFSGASRVIGKNQIRKLRTLKDHRVVQRYLAAIKEGKANGWHTVVFGIVLAVYGLPLRQGLVHYGRQTIRGFIMAGAQRLMLSVEGGEELHEEIAAPLPGKVAKLLETHDLNRISVLK